MSSSKLSLKTKFVKDWRIVSWLVGLLIMTNPDAVRAGWTEDFADAKVNLERSQCAQAWESLWRWARDDHRQANGAIAAAILVYGLYPPNLPDAEKNWKQVFLFFRLNSYSAKDAFTDDMSMSLLNGDTVRQPYGRKIAQCMFEKKSENCRDLAVRYRIVPSLAIFSKSVDRLPSQTAYCGARR